MSGIGAVVGRDLTIEPEEVGVDMENMPEDIRKIFAECVPTDAEGMD